MDHFGDHPSQQRRQNFLAVFLAGLFLMFFLVLLIFLTNGLFLYVLLLAGAIAAVALFHYVLWGRSLSQEVAGEREEEQLRQRAQAEDWPLPDANGFRRR
jgi:hypothetical protein